MLQLRQIAPLNYFEEKARFLADHSYNPQFTYAEPIEARLLTYYGLPVPELVEKAEHIANEYLDYKGVQLDERKHDALLTRDEIGAGTTQYLEKQGIINRYTITWSETAIARCSIKAREIIFRTDADYTSKTLQGVLNHEIGTHALRRMNDERQPWHDKKPAFGFKNSLMTEEGLATIHQYMDTELPILHSAAIKYLAVDIAQSSSFVQTWAELEHYYKNEDKLWNAVFRVKRGLEDTSQPGGFTKDLVYFAGAHVVGRWLSMNDYDVESLYLGRISVEDIHLARDLENLCTPVLPHFATTNFKLYKDMVARLMKENEIH